MDDDGLDPELLASTNKHTATSVPREQFIATAITFLQNSGVKRNPLNQKQNFLRTKGLTEDEIQIACERAGVFTGEPQSTSSASGGSGTVINMGITAPSSVNGGDVKYLHHHHHGVAPGSASCLNVGNKSMLQHVRDVVSASTLVAGVAYAVYMFYKNYIRPLLFGRDTDGTSAFNATARKRRRKTPEELMEDMSRSVEKSVASINQELCRVKEEVARTARQDALHREIATFKADLDSIKGLLLNRKQFSSPVLPPSIPAWQLQALQQQQQQQSSQQSAPTGIVVGSKQQHEDSASVSGSSETEVVNKNSDSSIELI